MPDYNLSVERLLNSESLRTGAQSGTLPVPIQVLESRVHRVALHWHDRPPRADYAAGGIAGSRGRPADGIGHGEIGKVVTR